MNKTEPLIRSIEIKTSYKCDSHCNFCLFGDRKYLSPMTLEEITSNIDYFLSKYPLEEIVISGGEPLIRRDLSDIINYAVSKNISKIYLHTNGKIKSFTDMKLLGCKLTKLMVSCHSIEDFKNKDKFIQYFLQRNIDLRTNTLLFENNYRDLLAVIKEINDIGVSRILLSFPFPIGLAEQNYSNLIPKNPEELKQSLEKSISYCSKNNIALTIQGLPQCFLKPHYSLQDVWIDRLFIDKEFQEEKAIFLFRDVIKCDFLEECSCCSLISQCNGFWFNHPQLKDYIRPEPVKEKNKG